MKVAVVAEFYPRAADPVLGSWAHNQAVAARDAGADVRVLVLHRPVPPRSTLREGGAAGAARAAARALRQPGHATLDGIEVTYVPFVSPPRSRSYGSWGAWAAPSLVLALRGLRRRFGFDLVHAHYAVPAADAVLRARAAAPLVVSEHGGDLYHTAPASDAGRAAVERAFVRARVVLANSAAVAERCRGLGAREVRVVHLGTDVPPEPAPVPREPVIASVGHLVARKRHADVVRALWLLRDRHPDLRYVVVGAGPERESLGRLAADLGLDGRVEFRGQLPPPAARDAARHASALVMPSVDEAFGVAYVEAMAAGVPAVGCQGEAGPEEIAAIGGGMVLVPPGDVEALADGISTLLSDAAYRRELCREARATVQRAFTWERCGAATVAAYEEALR
jgi:teichuronic acid biosynthesis glycosyltransferase TuaC